MSVWRRRRSSINALRVDEKIQLELRRIDAEHATLSDLFLAIEGDDYASVSTLLSHGVVNVNGTDHQLWTPLMLASLKGMVNATERLILAGADLEAADRHGCTALMVAACTGHDACLARLIAAGSDPDATDEFGNTALSLAAVRGRLGCVQSLLAARATVEVTDTRGMTPVAVAALHGHLDVLTVLLEGADRELPRTSLDHSMKLRAHATGLAKADGREAETAAYRLFAVDEMLGENAKPEPELVSPTPELEPVAAPDPAVAAPEIQETGSAPDSQSDGQGELSEEAEKREEAKALHQMLAAGEAQQEDSLERARRIREGAAQACLEVEHADVAEATD